MTASSELREWPVFLAYFLSFSTVPIMRTNHHELFRLIWRSNHTFLVINGLLPMFVTLVPFGPFQNVD